MLTVHHLEESRSIRVVWLLEELGADYDIDHYERDPDTRLAPDRLREVHPVGRAPVVTDGERTVAESAVILDYLLDRFDDGTLRPDDDTDAAQLYRYWMHYAEGTAMPDLVMQLVFEGIPEQAPWPVGYLLGFVTDAVVSEHVRPRVRRHVEFWEDALDGREYFASDSFTAADIQMSVPVGLAVAGFPEDRYPRTRAWLDRIRRRPAFETACERIDESAPLVPDD